MEQDPSSSASPDIYEASSKCSELFVRYLQDPSTSNKDEAEDLQSRFNLWTAYTGACAAAGASLDDRLRFHDEVRLMIVKLLLMLQRNLQTAIERSEDAQFTLADSHITSSPPQETFLTAESYHGLHAVSAALDRLQRLATAIRRSSVNRSEKLSTSMMPSAEDSYFEDCIFGFVQGRFPAARPSLLKQLTAALCYHRKRLLYQCRHNKKLAQKRPKEPTTKQEQPMQLSATQYKVSRLPSPRDQPVVARGIAPSVAFSKTNASIPSILRLNRALAEAPKQTPSIASTGTTSLLGETYFYPDPPLPGNSKYLPCPYCAETLEASKLDLGKRRNVNFWRNHLDQDLQPYFCIAEECKDPLRFFVDFEAWHSHMMNFHPHEWPRYIHGAVWICHMCSGQPLQFNDGAEFDVHMSSTHGDLTKTQRAARMKRGKTRALRDRWTCPLCACIPSKLSQISSKAQDAEVHSLLERHMGSHSKPSQISSKTQDEEAHSLFERHMGSRSKLSQISPKTQDEEAHSLLERHIGSHIKALSLLSFRFHLSDEGGDDFSGASTDENVSVEALLPETHHGKSSKGSRSTLGSISTSQDIDAEMSATNLGREQSVPRDDEDLEPPELLGSGSWNFIPMFEHLGVPKLGPLQAPENARSTQHGTLAENTALENSGPVTSSESGQSTQVIIAVMGRAGAGKTSFIQRVAAKSHVVAEQSSFPEAPKLRSHDIIISPVYPLADTGAQDVAVSLVDCPGFDNVKDDMEQILSFLGALHKRRQRLHGIIYAMDITRPCDDEVDAFLATMMQRLCGYAFRQNIALLTTHWDQLEDFHLGVDRESEITSTPYLWRGFNLRGSRIARTGFDDYWSTSNLNLVFAMTTDAPHKLYVHEEMDRGLEPSQLYVAELVDTWDIFVSEKATIWTRFRSSASVAESFRSVLKGLEYEIFKAAYSLKRRDTNSGAIICDGTKCGGRRINVEVERYYHCCLCNNNNYDHCMECGPICPKARIRHPPMYLVDRRRRRSRAAAD